MNNRYYDYAVEKGKEGRGNWEKFDSFAWHDRPEDADEFAIVYTLNRDSRLIDQSNAEVIQKEMNPFVGEGDCFEEHHTDWACGWMDGYAIRCFKKGTEEPTEAWLKYCSLMADLEEYPVLDDEDHSNKEYEATIDWISENGYRYVASEVDNGWEDRVYKWLWDNNQIAIENTDDQGGTPTDEEIIEALKALDMLDPEYDVEEI